MLGCRSECEFERADLVASERLEALGQPGAKGCVYRKLKLGMVETSLEAVAVCGAALLSDAFAPVPSPSDRGFLNSSP